jgi:hypothetical protein
MLFKQKTKPNLETLRSAFESQKKFLQERGYPDLVSETQDDFFADMDALWNSLSEKAGSLEFSAKGSVPLLIVPNSGDVAQTMELINASTELALTNLKAEPAVPGRWYLLLDVEDGSSTVAKSPESNLKKFTKEQRHPLTLQESMALLALRPDILNHHYVVSAGSFYIKDGQTQPLLWLLDPDHHPELHYAWIDIAHGSYGTASCAVKIIKS